MEYLCLNKLIRGAILTIIILILFTSVSTQGFDRETPDISYDNYIEANNLTGIPLKTQQLNIKLPSRPIDSEKMEAKITVDGPYRFSTQDREWGPHAHYLGINSGDNAWVSSCKSGMYLYVCSKQGPNSVTVFQTQNGVEWEYVTLSFGSEVNYPDIDLGSGYIYISLVYTSNKNPGIVRSTYANNVGYWGSLHYWTGYTDTRTISVGAPIMDYVCLGFHTYGQDDIRYFHTSSFPDNFLATIAYNPYSSMQRDVEIDGGYGSGTKYIYTANSYFDSILFKYQGRVAVYELDSNSLTVTTSERVAWSDTSSNEKLTLHGDDDKFTIAYQYYETSSHNIYARTYENYGAYKIPLGHVAEHTASDMYPRVFHDPTYDYKYFVYLKLAGGGDVYTSVADSDNTWTISEEKVLDSMDSRHTFRGVCTIHTGAYGQRQIVAWIDERDYYDNVYYNLEMPPNEGCPGEEIDISTWTPGCGASITINNDLNSASDDIYEITEVSCWSGDSTSEKVYKFKPPEDMSIQIDLIGSDFNTKMAIVAPCPDGSHTCMYNDDYSGENAGFDCTEFQGGYTYSIIVSGDNEKGYFSLNLLECSSVPCTELGCTIYMPSTDFGPGDECYCDVTVCNPEATTYSDIPVFVILDIYGSYFFAPSFNNYDHYTENIAPGQTIIPVLPSFNWPSNTGSATGILWYAAMTDQDITELFGDYDIFEFGWHS